MGYGRSISATSYHKRSLHLRDMAVSTSGVLASAQFIASRAQSVTINSNGVAAAARQVSLRMP